MYKDIVISDADVGKNAEIRLSCLNKEVSSTNSTYFVKESFIILFLLTCIKLNFIGKTSV